MMQEEDLNYIYVAGGIVIILVVFNLGIIGVIRLVVLAVLFLLAALVAFLLALYSGPVDETLKCTRIQVEKPSLNLRPSVSESRKPSNQLTGSEAVDGPLGEIVDFVIRDFVTTWYSKLAESNRFPNTLRSCLNRIIGILAERMIQVDWVEHLTTSLVDDVASHLRLFKIARNKMRSPTVEADARGNDLEAIFFKLEVDMEGTVCRDSVCTDNVNLHRYLQDICDLLLYLLLPEHEYDAGSVRVLTREILACSVLQPLLNLVADPDTININIIWLLKNTEVRSDVMISTLRYSDSLDELEACRASIQKELSRLRSCDSRSEGTEEAKNQKNSLEYLKKIVDSKINRLQSGFSNNSYGLPANIDWSARISSSVKLFNLPLEVLLKNNISLSYFIDFMSSIGSQYLVFFYLSIEGWKVTAESHLQAIELEILKQEEETKNSMELQTDKSIKPALMDRETSLDIIREAAMSIYREYLSDKASPRVNIEDTLSKRLLLKIRTETPDPDWFDEVAGDVYQSLETDDKYLASFKRSQGYLKLLAELDLLKVDHYEEDEDGSMGSLGESIGENSSGNSIDAGSWKSLGAEYATNEQDFPGAALPAFQLSGEGGSEALEFITKVHVEILRSDYGREENGKQFALYVLQVIVGTNKSWEISRRYSDFHYFQSTLNSEFPVLEKEKIPFPGKKAFGNLERNIVAKRQKMLNAYIQELVIYTKRTNNASLSMYIRDFLDASWVLPKAGVMGRAVNAAQDIQRSVKTGVKVVTDVPSNIARNVDHLFDGITKVFVTKDMNASEVINSVKVGASIEENEDNIPLRITLLFLDEVFDLADRNMWLRRQSITVLRQIIHHMLGGVVNKKIVHYFSTLTSEEAVSSYLTSLKEAIWPDGKLAASAVKREEGVKQRCRVAARASLIAALPDELRRVIGSETSRTGLVMLFEMLQNTTLNRRLAIVILEGILIKLFPEHRFKEMIEKLHSRSENIRNDYKSCQRTASDLRQQRS